MSEVIAYEGIPGKNNLDLAIKHLAEHDILSRGQMTGMSFANFPPISVNNLYVEEECLERASELQAEWSAAGWEVHSQKLGGEE